MKDKPFVRGDEIKKIITIDKFKKIMTDFFKGYPAYEYFGIFEYYFGKEIGERIVELLRKDGLIEVIPKQEGRLTRYRLSGNGIRFVISMREINLTEKLTRLTEILVGFGLITIFLISIQLTFQILQYFKPT